MSSVFMAEPPKAKCPMSELPTSPTCCKHLLILNLSILSMGVLACLSMYSPYVHSACGGQKWAHIVFGNGVKVVGKLFGIFGIKGRN